MVATAQEICRSTDIVNSIPGLMSPGFMPLSTAIPSQVRKRDGVTLQSFDFTKIVRAIRAAWEDTGSQISETKLSRVSLFVANTLHGDLACVTDVEQIQDAVEVALMKYDLYAVAKAYIVYRQKRATLREARRTPDSLAISDYIHASKYARYIPELMRREVFSETIERDEAMHLRRFAHLPELLPKIRWAFDRVREKKVLPSMRSLQFGGAAIEAQNCRIYNCTTTYIDRPRAFAEALYLLLCGCGVGYSVQFDHIEKLPALQRIDSKKVVHHVIADTIEGWANALDELINSFIKGYYVEFSYHLIRTAGVPLKTSGGKAPGHLKLKESLELIRTILQAAQGRKLRPVEAHRIICLAAEAVLSGGIRRSAAISLFSPEDSEMVYLKTGNWFTKEPWLANANNSVVFKRSDVKKKQFKRIFQMVKEWGEPGFIFVEDNDYVYNPCAEIGTHPRLTVNEVTRPLIVAKLGKAAADAIPDGATYSGYSFCNLCEINAAKFQDLNDFVEAAYAATIIGTLQASYTTMPYLGWVSEVIAERDALLGISMTGMLDAPQIACNPEYQRQVAEKVKGWNKEIAALIGIRSAARTTCTKPAGTSSLALGGVASGHHAHHARRYIRRVTADALETVFQAFKETNPSLCVRKPDGKWVIEFPVLAPDGAIVKEDLSALSFLEMVKSTQQNWVLPGTARTESPGLNHNVSNTVHIKPDEWDKVAEYLWAHRERFTGVSLVSATSDKDFSYAPNEAVVTDTDEARWNQLIANYIPVDYTTILEEEDGTSLRGEQACAGGACEVHF